MNREQRRKIVELGRSRRERIVDDYTRERLEQFNIALMRAGKDPAEIERLGNQLLERLTRARRR